MFWKKNTVANNVLTKETAELTSTYVGSKPTVQKKEKKLSKKDIIINQIIALEMGQIIRYKFPELYGGDSAVIKLDSKSTDVERKYVLSMQKLVDGKPVGDLNTICNTTKPKQIAEFILNSNGEFFATE